MNSAPNSTGTPALLDTVWIRPPLRWRASSSITSMPAAESARAAESPAAPAPTTITVPLPMSKTSTGSGPMQGGGFPNEAQSTIKLRSGYCPLVVQIPTYKQPLYRQVNYSSSDFILVVDEAK